MNVTSFYLVNLRLLNRSSNSHELIYVASNSRISPLARQDPPTQGSFVVHVCHDHRIGQFAVFAEMTILLLNDYRISFGSLWPILSRLVDK